MSFSLFCLYCFVFLLVFYGNIVSKIYVQLNIASIYAFRMRFNYVNANCVYSTTLSSRHNQTAAAASVASAVVVVTIQMYKTDFELKANVCLWWRRCLQKHSIHINPGQTTGGGCSSCCCCCCCCHCRRYSLLLLWMTLLTPTLRIHINDCTSNGRQPCQIVNV